MLMLTYWKSKAASIRGRGVALLMLVLASDATAQVESIIVDFSTPASQEQVALSGRSVFQEGEGRVLLRGSGAVFLKHPTGPGTYRVRFSLSEPKGFSYHANLIRLFVPSPAKPAEGGYSVQWTRAGLFSLIPGQRFIQPGRENPHRFAESEIVELAIVIPRENTGISLHKGSAEAESICMFKLSDRPTRGYFGFLNQKSHSEIAVYSLAFDPANDAAP